MGNYLGIPESLGGAKTKIFNFLIDRQQKRINGWTSKLLSRGGKEVLIKSVASAMPTHVMSCFRLPKGVTNKLTSAVSNFWWSNNGQTRGMHWLAWKKLCKHKNDGGLGFRVIEDFNTALLAKQLWRLIDCPESLFAKVFKGRYFRNTTPLAPIRSYSPSYGWRSIVSARPLVYKGLIKRVGSGTSISVWNDPWIPASRPRPAICRGINYYPHLQVNELIDPNTLTWNLPLLRQIFYSAEVSLINGIPTTSAHRPDSLGWYFTKSGRYTVKSGYLTAQQYPDEVSSIPFGPDTRRLQAHAWKVRCPSKLNHFLWQIVTGCVAVGARLQNRGMQIDPQCMRCGMQEETINHALFECPPALQIWALSSIPTPPQVFPTAAVFTNMAHLFWHLPKDDRMSAYPWILWYIWKSRNNDLFSDRDKDLREYVAQAEAEAAAWADAQQRQEITQSVVRLVAEPRTRTIYCQSDGAWKETECRSGLGWYFQDTITGEELMGSSNLRRGLTPLQTEVEASIWAMQCMIQHNKQDVNFETDCSDVVKMVSNPEEWPTFSILLEEIDRCKKRFTTFSIHHIPRTKNTKADKLARSARDLLHDVYYVNSIPPAWISGTV